MNEGEKIVSFDELEEFKNYTDRVYEMGESMIGRQVIVNKELLGIFSDEGQLDEVSCTVIGYDVTAFKVEYYGINYEGDTIIEDYILYSELVNEDEDEDEIYDEDEEESHE